MKPLNIILKELENIPKEDNLLHIIRYGTNKNDKTQILGRCKNR